MGVYAVAREAVELISRNDRRDLRGLRACARVGVDDVTKLMKGDGSGRVQR